MDQQTPSWGIRPVPQRLRVLGLLDLTLLWGNLSVSLLVIVAAAGLVPMLSFQAALLAILIGAFAGSVLLGLAAMIGADARVPGMVLLRAPLGRRGSYAPTVLNVAQNLGWSTFELIILSTAAAALSERVFGFRERWLWALVFGAISLALGLLGPIGFVRRYLKKFAVWAVAASIVYLTWWVLDKANLHALWHQPGTGGVTIGQGIDLVIANIVSWTPLAADYTRFARDRRSAFFGSGVGYLVPTVWCFGIGSLLVLSRDLSEPTQIPTVVATGSALAVIALLMLTVDERDVFDGPRVRWPLLGAWAAGFALYQWLSPQGPSWWTDQVEHLSPGHATLTASVPSFALAFCLTLLVTRLDSLRAAARSRREPLARPR